MDCAELGRELRSLAVECDSGTASGLAAHFNVAPGDPMIPAGADGLHGGFFRGEAGGVALYPIGLRFAVSDLGLGKDPMQEAIAEADDGRFDAWYFSYVDAGANNHADSLAVGPSEENKNVILLAQWDGLPNAFRLANNPDANAVWLS